MAILGIKDTFSKALKEAIEEKRKGFEKIINDPSQLEFAREEARVSWRRLNHQAETQLSDISSRLNYVEGLIDAVPD